MPPELKVAAAWLLDILLGDPRWLPHPVRLMGWAALRLKDFFLALFRNEGLAGAALALALPVGVFFVAAAAVHAAGPLGLAVEIFLIYTALATHSLFIESFAVLSSLRERDLDGARRGLSMIVGRDTEHLDETGIVRAVVETVAESASDGIVAPLFYALIGGAPLALAYKAVNTLDSMFGYRDERFLCFGRASAKLDDLVNWIPARITGGLMVLAACYLRYDWRRAWSVMARDGRKNPSPNSGIPEAAAAGALGVQLGGINFYFGKPSRKEIIGDHTRELEREDITRAQRLMLACSFFAMIVLGGVSYILRIL